MANQQAFCNSAKGDLLNGLHALGNVYRTRDTFKAALYTAASSLGAATTTYTGTTTEVSGSGYTAGGQTVTNATNPAVTTGVAYWTPSAAIAWTTVTLATAFDCVLIYNDTASGKNALSVHTFGSQTVSSGNFTLTMPVNNESTGLIRIA